ncbi:MAG: hypothetical protein WBD22_02950 [Pyrinomonadaceae bacterium]
MFEIISTVLWIMIVGNPSGSPVLENEYRQDQAMIIIDTQCEPQQCPILSKDPKVAKEALDKAISERDEETIRLGLKKAQLSFKKEITLAVRNAYFQSFVPDFIDLLEVIQAGDKHIEVKQAHQQELKEAVIAALVHFTGLRFQNGGSISNNDVENIIQESREWYRANGPEIQQALTAEMLERQQETPILSRNYNVAKWAYDKAVSEGDKSTIRKGLDGLSLLLKRNVVEAIAKFNDKSFVPDLIKALEENQSLMSGGSETQAEKQELNKEIISALKQLTGLDFLFLKDSSMIPCFDDCPSKDIERVLRESREWQTAQKNKHP